MANFLSNLLDQLSEFLAHRKGLLPILGIVLILANFALQFFPGGWLAQTDFLLHLGLILAIIGFLLARAL